jgi:hypothetical protein
VSVLPIVLIVAAVAILGGVIVVAMGRGGELAPSSADVPPLDTDIVTAADVALLRPPAALWGYDMRATDEALNRVARTVTERDVEIADLRRQLADMQAAPPDPRGTADDPRGTADDPPGTAADARATAADTRGTASGPRGTSREVPRETRNPRHAAGPPDAAGREAPDQDPVPGAPDPGPRPPALPFRRAVGGPTRPPAGEQSWSAWERPGPAGGQEPDDYPETGTASGGRA